MSIPKCTETQKVTVAAPEATIIVEGTCIQYNFYNARLKVPLTPKIVFRLIKCFSFPDYFSENIILIDEIPTFLQAFKHAISIFTITAEIHARSLANCYCQYADRHEFEIHATRQRARAGSSPICYRKINKLTSVFYASVLLLTMNFVITLSN